MERTKINHVGTGSTVRIQGFADAVRTTKSMGFLVVRDDTGKMQVTIVKGQSAEIDEALSKLTVESAVTVEGEIVENSHVKLGGREMLPTMLRVESVSDAMPLLPDSGIDARIDYRWIDLRSEKNACLFRAQTVFVGAMREYLLARDFMEIHTPKLIGAASESGSEVFELKYFDRKAYLSQSPQFYKQMAMAAGFDRIFETGPVFRAEKSHTRKHATEFTGFDLEFSWIDSYEDVMKLEEELLAFALGKLKEKCGDDIERLFGIPVIVPQLPFPVIDLKDLYAELESRYGFTVPEEEKGDLTTEAELLCEKFAMEKYGHEFLFITGYSAAKRAFYHMRKDGVPQGYDLIWKGVEITTGAQREHRFDQLKAQADEKGLGDDVKFYLEFFRYGCPPHGGFGMGVDRLMMLISGLSIKEVMFLFRGPNRLTP